MASYGDIKEGMLVTVNGRGDKKYNVEKIIMDPDPNGQDASVLLDDKTYVNASDLSLATSCGGRRKRTNKNRKSKRHIMRKKRKLSRRRK